jgi:hypothetical protein
MKSYKYKFRSYRGPYDVSSYLRWLYIVDVVNVAGIS